MDPSPSLHARIAAAFDDQELRTLCFGRFPVVEREFTIGMTRMQKVGLLLDYCIRHKAGEALLDVLEQERPGLVGGDRATLLAWLDAARLDSTSVTANDTLGQTIVNQASNAGAQGIFHAPVYIGTPPSATPALYQLRAPVGDFVGREQEIAQLVQAARRGTVAAISGIRGMGGIGKTELAYVVAHQLAGDFPDAQIVIDLRGASDPLTPSQALQKIIRAFEREARLSDDLAELQAIYRSLLSGKRMLVLADDAEGSAQMRPLLPPPGSALLITSRYRFTLPGMHTIDLGMLAPAEAEALLQAICPRIGEAAPALAKLCGYLPLALRVSAGLLANDATLSVTRYLERLADERSRLAGLRDGEDVALNVDASLNLSYAALDSAAQSALCQLSVFVADFDLSAAQAVVVLDQKQPLEAVPGDLYRRSLLDYDSALERYSLHDLVRVFARARLDTEVNEPLMLRYAQHYAQVADRADALYLQGGESALMGLGLFDRERAHIDAGWAWARGQGAGWMIDEMLIAYTDATLYIGALRYDVRGERIPQLEAALVGALRHRRRADQGRLLGTLGNAYALLGEIRRAIELFKQQLEVVREVGDRRGEGRALGNLGIAYADLGEVQRAIELYKQVLIITREVGDRRGEGRALGGLGSAYKNLGEMQPAIDCYEQDVAITREVGDRRGEGAALGNLASIHALLGEERRAIELYEQRLKLAREIGDPHGEARGSWNLGELLVKQGNLARAVALMQFRVDYDRSIGHVNAEVNAARVEKLHQQLQAAEHTAAPEPDSHAAPPV